MFGEKGGSRNVGALILLLLAGIVLGGFIGKYLGSLPYMGWLSYEQQFGFDTPFVLNLNVIKLQFALLLRISMASILGIIISIVVYRHL